MTGHIFCKIPDDLWIELKDLKVEFNLGWSKTIEYMCDLVPRPRKQNNYSLHYPNGDKTTINLQVSNEVEKKFKKFSNVFDNYWQALDYLVENVKQKRKTFI